MKKLYIFLFLFLVVVVTLSYLASKRLERLDGMSKNPKTLQEKIDYVMKYQGLGNHAFEDCVVISKPTVLQGISTKRIFLINTKTGIIISAFTDKEYPLHSKVKIQYYHVMLNYPTKNITAYPIIVP